jgi:AraC-like DNA-binding protein
MDKERVEGGNEKQRQRLVKLLDRVAVHEGAHPTPIEGVELWRASAPIPRHPVVYQPKIAIVGQGYKRGYLGGQVYRYDPHHYLVLTVPLPYECETDASPDEPLLGVTVALDPTMLGEMLLEMDEAAAPDAGVVVTPRGIYSTPLTVELSDSVVRLLDCLRSPLDSRVLGRQMAREVVYRVLGGEQGGALRALASRNEHFTRIARVLRCIHAEYDHPLTNEALARRAGMSPSVFHHNFKLVTATSPLQYLKQVRLHRARTLMAHDGLNAGRAAAQVGYESPSQFSREFKRLFGVTPLGEAEHTRARLVAG